MPGRLSCGLAIASLLALATACGTSPPSRYYTLDSTATSDGTPALGRAIAVGPVSIPGSVDRPELVVQVAPNQVEVDEFDRWAAPLDDAIARTVAGNLAVLLATPEVASAPLANFAPAYRVTIDVQRFESAPGDAALVDAVWAVAASAGGEPRTGRTVAREPVQGTGFDALAAAHSRALAKLSGDIAAAIRSAAGAR